MFVVVTGNRWMDVKDTLKAISSSLRSVVTLDFLNCSLNEVRTKGESARNQPFTQDT